MIATDLLKRWKERPDIFVREVFGIVPDDWQDEVLRAFPHSPRIAMKASKGPGKTACLAWMAWNFMLTRPYPKIAATSITGSNLADNLWAELAKYQQRSEMLKQTFSWTKTRIFANDHPETWWMSARPWSKSANKDEQGNTLAGLHADYILFLIDESGAIPPVIGAAAEAALSSCIEGHIVQAGNTNSLDGMLYQACVKNRHAWNIITINGDPDDPKRSPRVNVEWAREQVRMYGRDNPFVLINVFGEFPPASFNSLIGIDEVEASMRRDYKIDEFERSARVLGVDVARSGADASVIFPRQGIQAFTPLKYRNIDGTVGAGLVARKWTDWKADACFVDDTGGFGASWIDNLLRLGYSPIGIHFSEKSANPRYANKRTEMIFDTVEWIKRGGALPKVPELLSALVETTYTFKGDALIIEPKEMIKERIGYSPDDLDALSLSFAQPVIKASYQEKGSHQTKYDPCSREHIRETISGSNHKTIYDPFDRNNRKAW